MKQIITVAMILLVFAALCQANPALSDGFDGRIDQGLLALYQGNYDQAFETYDSIIRDHPGNPAGYFLKAGAYQLKSMAHETEAWDEKYNACLDSTMKLSEAAIAANKDDAWAFFFRGGTYAYRAARAARRASYLSALSNGLSALSDLNRALELDPKLYDAYLGIGSYHYFRTKATSIIKWLPFIGDARDKGIEEIKRAIASGRFSKVTAQNGLLWIYIDYGKYDQAVELGLQLEKEFPLNHVFFWSVPEAYWRSRRWDKAAEHYASLLRLVDASRPLNNFNRVEIKYRLAKCLLELGKNQEAARQAREAIELPLDDESARRLQGDRRRAQDVMFAAEKRMKK